MLDETLHYFRRLLSDESSGGSSPSLGDPSGDPSRGDGAAKVGFLRGEDGAAMVEFVLIFPIQLTLTLAILQFALLQYATLVVQQAADLSARAAAVSDVMTDLDGTTPDQKANEAALRMAARQCALLSPGIRADNQFNGGAAADTFSGLTMPTNGELKWGGNAFSEGREAQAYGLLQRVEAVRSDGEVNCTVTYDYLMSIPVGAQFMQSLNAGSRAQSAARGGRTVWPITRKGRCVAPWIR